MGSSNDYDTNHGNKNVFPHIFSLSKGCKNIQVTTNQFDKYINISDHYVAGKQIGSTPSYSLNNSLSHLATVIMYRKKKYDYISEIIGMCMTRLKYAVSSWRLGQASV